MPSVVIKPDRDRDEYVVWSTVTESPHSYGNRVEMALILQAGVLGCDVDPDKVLRDAAHWGSSASSQWAEGHWEDESFIFKQIGYLPRANLFAAARMMGAVGGCRLRDVLAHVVPFEDDDGREHYRRILREYGDDVVSLEGEREMAGLALAQIKATVASWNN